MGPTRIDVLLGPVLRAVPLPCSRVVLLIARLHATKQACEMTTPSAMRRPRLQLTNFEPPLPSLAPALAAPDIKPSVDQDFFPLHYPPSAPSGDQPGLASCRPYRLPSHTRRFSDHPPVGTGHPAPPLPASNVLLFSSMGRGGKHAASQLGGRNKTIAKGGPEVKLPRSFAQARTSWGPAGRVEPLTSLWTSLISWTASTGAQWRKLTFA